jgi:hypothetical protein
MSAATALRSARQAGVTIATDGDDLVLQAKAPPPTAIIEALRRHKTEIVALLTPATSGRAANACAAWEADDWLADFDERAGIAECDGGLNRLEAEALAFECSIVAWLDANPEPSSPGLCARCGAGEASGSVVNPYGTQNHTWLHPECWATWYQRRRRQAETALAGMGIGVQLQHVDEAEG